MARRKESVRENKAIQSILRGETPERRVFVAQEDLEFKKKLKKEAQEEQKRIDEKLEATKEAINKVDTCIGELVKSTGKMSGTLLITADHGNAEVMKG